MGLGNTDCMHNRYRQISNVRRAKSPCFSSRFAVVFLQYIETRGKVENDDVTGAAPTGDAPTTSEWSQILLLTKARRKLEVWRYIASRQHIKYLLR